MASYHVKINWEDGKILAGTLTKTGKWQNSSEVTEEVLAAARDHLLYQIVKENRDMFYSWNYPNGKTILLKLAEMDSSEIKSEENGTE